MLALTWEHVVVKIYLHTQKSNRPFSSAFFRLCILYAYGANCRQRSCFSTSIRDVVNTMEL